MQEPMLVGLFQQQFSNKSCKQEGSQVLLVPIPGQSFCKFFLCGKVLSQAVQHWGGILLACIQEGSEASYGGCVGTWSAVAADAQAALLTETLVLLQAVNGKRASFIAAQVTKCFGQLRTTYFFMMRSYTHFGQTLSRVLVLSAV